MYSQNKNNEGFSQILILVLLGIFTLICGVGWYVYKVNNKPVAATTSQSPAPSLTRSVDEKSADAQTEQTIPASNTSPKPTQATPSTNTSNNPVPSTIGSAYITFKITDDSSQQLSPVKTVITASSATVTVDLKCIGSCRFKLMSDNYSFSDTNTYTSSQIIKYPLNQKGTFTLYNQYQPAAVKSTVIIN